MIVPIIGSTALIPHKWSEKALNMMREAQSGNKLKSKKEPKNPEQEANDATYWIEEGVPGMPATAFKAAIVAAARHFEGVTMVALKTAIFVQGVGIDQLIRIEGPYEIFESTPRVGMGTADLRYRNRIFPWSAELRINYLRAVIDSSSVVALVDAAGRGGVGDWRPSSPKSHTGSYGTFKVDTTKTVKVSGS